MKKNLITVSYTHLFDHDRLIIEITEDSLIQNGEQAAANIEACRKMGFKIAIDDMGSGFTAVSYTHLINTGQQVERRHKKYLSRQLTRTGNMIAFDKMLEDLYREEPRQATEYLSQLGGVIVYLTIRYGRKDRIEAAYFQMCIRDRHRSHLLGQVMREDPHNGVHGYRIRSLYFDTVYDEDYHEKLAGIETRRKIRLRCYDPAAGYAMLEMKQKQGASQLKRSLRVTREVAQRLITGDYTPLLQSREAFEMCIRDRNEAAPARGKEESE